jgi:glucokinase
MILAGDIGGTNTRLAFFDVQEGKFRLASASIFPSRDYRTLDEIAVKFVATTGIKPQMACFGIAGPVRGGRVVASNLPWIIEAQKLGDEIHVSHAVLINDLEASAWGVPAMEREDLIVLNPGASDASGNQAVIAAGTGLGEAGMYWDGVQHHVFACEGGHTDFAPRDDLQVELFQYLRAKFGRVSYERVLSGPGLVNIYNFLTETGRGTPSRSLAEDMQQSDPAAVISRAALKGDCRVAEQALDLFVSVYGAEAGNLALKAMATGGVFIAGGIAPKILPKLTEPPFMKAFLDKGRMRPVLEATPVKIITNDQLNLLGAARCAVVKSAG